MSHAYVTRLQAVEHLENKERIMSQAGDAVLCGMDMTGSMRPVWTAGSATVHMNPVA